VTRFRFKLTFTILGLISVVMVLMGVFFAKIVERSYLETLQELLWRESRFIAETIDNNSQLEDRILLKERLQQFSPADDVRVTIIDQTGEVRYDSESNPEGMENHAHRPEFESALRGKTGTARRYSDTLGFDMLYVAVPVTYHGEVIGSVRSAMSMEEIATTIHRMWYSLLTGLFITLVVGSLVVSKISSNISKPIEEITRVAKAITQRQFESRVKLRAKDEIGQLAGAINFMASSLEQQMYEISENQQRLTGVLTNMTSGVIFVSENRRIMLVNPAVEKLLGTSHAELIGKLHIEAGKSFGLSQYIDRCIDLGEKFREEVHIYYPQERILDVSFAPYINYKGEAKGVVAVLHDITEIRRLEKLRSNFVANVSHELRTPITSIKGFTETLLDGAMHDEEICRNFLQIIYDESERLNRMIRDTLDLSRIEMKKIPLTLENLHVNTLITDLITLVQEQASKKQLTIRFHESADIWMVTDRDSLHQILLNLVSNSIAYTPEGGIITLEISQDASGTSIRVSDTGIGIPEKDLGRIFERFYRVDKARTRDSGGTGLGLAIVKHLIDNLHGNIKVESEEGKGTTFTLSFSAK